MTGFDLGCRLKWNRFFFDLLKPKAFSVDFLFSEISGSEKLHTCSCP